MDHNKNNKSKKKFFLLLFLLLFLIWCGYIVHNYIDVKNTEPEIYFSNDQNWTGWEGLDYILQNGEIHISRFKYMAPHIKYDFSLEEVRHIQEKVAFKLRFQLDAFMNNMFGLMTIYSPSGNVCVVFDREGRLGLVSDPEGLPIFSNRKIELGKEHVIFLYIDSYEGEISVFVDGSRVVLKENSFDFYPITDVWLGSVWIGGENHFGAPLGYKVNDFNIGNKDLIFEEYSFLGFIKDFISDNYWRLLLPLLIFILILIFISIYNKMRSKQELDS